MAFTEALHKRGTGAQGGQFVASDGTKSAALGYDGKRGSGYGSKGGDANVKKLQKELNRLGIGDAQGKSLVVDGKFGPRTTAAVRRLQRRLGLPVDGKITPALLKRLKGIKKTTTLTEKPVKAAKKAMPAARKAVPARKPQPARPAKKVAPVRRSIGYSGSMTDIDRHGTHNQKSHANRLGRPENVAGKTGLAKATAALADKPEQGPARAPERKQLSAVQIRDILKGGRPSYMGNSRRNEDHLRILKDAGIGDEQAREILQDLGVETDRNWEATDIGFALHHRAEDEIRGAAEAEHLNRLKVATPSAFARLLGTDGQEPLVKSKPVRAVFEAMQGNGWTMTGANSQTGWHAFSSADGDKTIKVLIGKSVVIYDDRINKISGAKALAYVKGSS